MSRGSLIFDSRQRLFKILVLITLLAGAAFPQLALDPIPSGIRYAEQDGSPIKISVDGIRRHGGNFRSLIFSIQNIGDKPVWAVATTGMPGTANVKTFFADSLEPGKKTVVTTHLDGELPSDTLIAADAVIFLDGTVWGPNISREADFLKGMRAGRLRLISDISEQLQKGDEKAVGIFINRQPYLPEFTSIEKKSKYEEGMVSAYGGGIMSFKHDLQTRGDIGAVSARLAVLKSQMGITGSSRNGKRIAKAFGFRELVTIEKVEVDGRMVPLNDEFIAGDDWIRGVVITLKNTSPKTIMSLTVNIDFPQTSSSGSMMRFPISYGRRPGLMQEVKIPERPPIKGAVSFQIGLSEQDFANLTRFLNERTLLSQLSRAEISIGMIFFGDGTAWSMGNMMSPDPSDPKRWIPFETHN